MMLWVLTAAGPSRALALEYEEAAVVGAGAFEADFFGTSPPADAETEQPYSVVGGLGDRWQLSLAGTHAPLTGRPFSVPALAADVRLSDGLAGAWAGVRVTLGGALDPTAGAFSATARMSRGLAAGILHMNLCVSGSLDDWTRSTTLTLVGAITAPAPWPLRPELEATLTHDGDTLAAAVGAGLTWDVVQSVSAAGSVRIASAAGALAPMVELALVAAMP